MADYANELARAALEIEAIQLRPNEPFTWASGYRMPVYNDNRLLLGYPAYRSLVAKAFESLIHQLGLQPDYIAGTPVAGIPHGLLLADRMEKPFIYGRKLAKDHGMQRRVEGVTSEAELHGKDILLVEDLISTGKSSVEAVELYKNIGAQVVACVSIFTYGFQKASETFSSVNVPFYSLLDFATLVKFVREQHYFSMEQTDVLADWQNDPFSWGEKHGFPKVEVS